MKSDDNHVTRKMISLKYDISGNVMSLITQVFESYLLFNYSTSLRETKRSVYFSFSLISRFIFIPRVTFS